MGVRLFISSILFLLFSFPSVAEECFEDTFVAAHMSCGSNYGNSADFTNGCQWEPDKTIKTPIPCPPQEAEWVNIRYVYKSQGPNRLPFYEAVDTPVTACTRLGMLPTTIDGASCASQRYRPSTGKNVENLDLGYLEARGLVPSSPTGGGFTTGPYNLFFMPGGPILGGVWGGNNYYMCWKSSAEYVSRSSKWKPMISYDIMRYPVPATYDSLRPDRDRTVNPMREDLLKAVACKKML